MVPPCDDTVAGRAERNAVPPKASGALIAQHDRWNPLRGSTLRGFSLRRYGALSGGTRFAVPPCAGSLSDDTVSLRWNPLRGSTLRGFSQRRYGAPPVEPAVRFHPTWVLPATIRCPSGGTRYAVPPCAGFTCDDTVSLRWNPLCGSTLRGFYLRRYGAPPVEPAMRFHPTRVFPATIRCPSGGTRYAVPSYVGFFCDDTVPLWWNPLRGSTLRGFFLRRYGAPSGGTRYAVPPYAGFFCDDTVPPLVEPATRFHPTWVLPATIR